MVIGLMGFADQCLLIGIKITFSQFYSIRNDKRYRRRGAASSEAQPNGVFDSSSLEGGAGNGGAALSKSYRQAWDNLRDPSDHKSRGGGKSSGHHHHHSSRNKEVVDDPNYRTRISEVVRDDGEMVVSDVYPKTKHQHGDKKRHHHHHHHKHGSKRNAGGDW